MSKELPHVYEELIKAIEEDGDIKEVTKKGLCRQWVRQVYKKLLPMLSSSGKNFSIEPREIHISPDLTHTILRIKIENELQVLFDGVGVEKHEPFFGLEEEAPSHLQNSHPDLLKYYL